MTSRWNFVKKAKIGLATLAAAISLSIASPAKAQEINISNSFQNSRTENSIAFAMDHSPEYDIGDKYLATAPMASKTIGPTPFSDSKKILSENNSSVSVFAKTLDARTEHPDYAGFRVRFEKNGSRSDLIIGEEFYEKPIPYLSSFSLIKTPAGNFVVSLDLAPEENIFSAGYFNNQGKNGFGAFMTYDAQSRKSLEQIAITDGSCMSRKLAYYAINNPGDPIWAMPFDFAERAGIRLTHSYSPSEKQDGISAEFMIYPLSYFAGRENVGNLFLGGKWNRTSFPGEKIESSWVSAGYNNGNLRVYLAKQVSGKQELAGGFDISIEPQKIAYLKGHNPELLSLGFPGFIGSK